MAGYVCVIAEGEVSAVVKVDAVLARVLEKLFADSLSWRM